MEKKNYLRITDCRFTGFSNGSTSKAGICSTNKDQRVSQHIQLPVTPPDGNAFICTGLQPDGRYLWVIDADIHTRRAENPDFTLSVENFTLLPPTYTVRTFSGGLHFYYYTEEIPPWTVPESSKKKLKFKDILGADEVEVFFGRDGTQVVIAPGTHCEKDGVWGTYEQMNTCAPTLLSIDQFRHLLNKLNALTDSPVSAVWNTPALSVSQIQELESTPEPVPPSVTYDQLPDIRTREARAQACRINGAPIERQPLRAGYGAILTGELIVDSTDPAWSAHYDGHPPAVHDVWRSFYREVLNKGYSFDEIDQALRAPYTGAPRSHRNPKVPSDHQTWTQPCYRRDLTLNQLEAKMWPGCRVMEAMGLFPTTTEYQQVIPASFQTGTVDVQISSPGTQIPVLSVKSTSSMPKRKRNTAGLPDTDLSTARYIDAIARFLKQRAFLVLMKKDGEEVPMKYLGNIWMEISEKQALIEIQRVLDFIPPSVLVDGEVPPDYFISEQAIITPHADSDLRPEQSNRANQRRILRHLLVTPDVDSLSRLYERTGKDHEFVFTNRVCVFIPTRNPTKNNLWEPRLDKDHSPFFPPVFGPLKDPADRFFLRCRPHPFDSKALCPETLKIIHTWARDFPHFAQIVTFLMDVVFYNPGKMATIHFVVGPGGTGKSTMGHLVQTLLGDFHTIDSTVPPDGFILAGLQKKGGIIINEVQGDRNWDMLSTFLRLTGGDSIVINEKHQRREYYKCLPDVRCVVVSNQIPNIPELREDHVERRLFVLTMDKKQLSKKENRDMNELKRLFRQEAPGIFSMLCSMRYALHDKYSELTDMMRGSRASDILESYQPQVVINEFMERHVHPLQVIDANPPFVPTEDVHTLWLKSQRYIPGHKYDTIHSFSKVYGHWLKKNIKGAGADRKEKKRGYYGIRLFDTDIYDKTPLEQHLDTADLIIPEEFGVSLSRILEHHRMDPVEIPGAPSNLHLMYREWCARNKPLDRQEPLVEEQDQQVPAEPPSTQDPPQRLSAPPEEPEEQEEPEEPEEPEESSVLRPSDTITDFLGPVDESDEDRKARGVSIDLRDHRRRILK